MKLKNNFAVTLIDEDLFMFPFILQLFQVLELIVCKCRRKYIPGECSSIELGMKCTEACVSHDCENFWNGEVELKNTELDEDDFDLEERIFEELH